jgi:hypothetical protein
MANPLTRLYRACDPLESLRPEDPRYVNCDDVRGENLALEYARGFRLADPAKPEVRVFAGHRGVGKTSELLRLKGLLETAAGDERPFLVIFADVTDKLDLNDVDFPDLLVFLAGEVQRQLREAKLPGFGAASATIGRLWDELKGLLGKEVDLTSIDADLPYAGLTLELKNRPNARADLRKAIERQSTSLVAAVNDLLDTATVKLRDTKREGLVLIVDGLDKVHRRELEDGRSNTHERLFIHRGEQLASIRAHVVYTVPISLIYAPEFAQVEQTFGGFQVPVPMIKVRGREGEDEPAGIAKLREMIDRRCRFADVDETTVFDAPETCRLLCEMSGGHPRHLMMLLRAATHLVDTLPITRAAVDRSVRNYGNSLLREVPDHFWPKLHAFDTPQHEIPKDDDHQQMLLLLHIFEYMNDRPWWEVNPVLRTLEKFRG